VRGSEDREVGRRFYLSLRGISTPKIETLYFAENCCEPIRLHGALVPSSNEYSEMDKQPLVLLSGLWDVEDCLVQLLCTYTLAASKCISVKLQKFSEKMEVTSKFQAPEEWQNNPYSNQQI
jgi:hypothetical protein